MPGADLVEKLRDAATMRRWWDQLGFEAADEIEALRRKLIDANQAIEEQAYAAKHEADALRERLAAVTADRNHWKEDAECAQVRPWQELPDL